MAEAARQEDHAMAVDQFERALRDWGHWYGEHRAKEWQESDQPTDVVLGATIHPIARAMEFAGGSGSPVGRSARSMAAIRKTPAWGFDAIPCTETRSHRISTPDDIPMMAQRVQAAALALYRIDPLRSICLRLNYCSFGTQHYKAIRATELFGQKIKVKRFRDELAFARIWVFGRLSA